MEALNDLINALKKFPGVGIKSARRIAFHLLKQNDGELERLGSLISKLKQNLYTCEICGNVSNKNPCGICSDPLRDRKTLCIVETLEALSAFEQAGIYNGLYHVLNNMGEELSDETADFLLEHVKNLKPDEIIIATSPRLEGDMMYYTILELLENTEIKKISRLAFGLPVGGSIEFADRMTLHMALESRRQVN